MDSSMKRNFSDSHSEQIPRRKRSRLTRLDQSNNPPESRLTQDTTSPVADAPVAGARSLGRTLSDQGSNALTIGMDQRENNTSQLSTLEKKLEASSKKRERFQEFQRNPQKYRERSLGLSREEILRIAEDFKQEAHNIAEICRESRVKGKSNFLEKFCDECDRYKKAYETSYDAVKNSRPSNLDSMVKDLRQYQQAVLLLSKFSINNLEEAQPQFIQVEEHKKFVNQMEECKQFIKQISDKIVITREQKQKKFEEYYVMFQEYQKNLAHLEDSIAQEKCNNIRDLARNVNYIKRDMVALGKIMESDYLQRDANLPHLQAIQEGTKKYMQALQEYNASGKEAEHLNVEDKLKLAQEKLLKMVKCVKKLSMKYSEITQSAITAVCQSLDTSERRSLQEMQRANLSDDRCKELSKDKGKEHVVDRPMTDLEDDSGDIAGTKHLESAEDRIKRIQGIYKSGM